MVMSMELNRILSKRLRELRKSSGYTLKSVANYLGVVYQTYQSYELGVNLPSINNLVKLADLFDVSTDYLLGRTEF